jgi:hypothetical protein
MPQWGVRRRATVLTLVPVARFCRADAVNVWADAFATRSRDKDFMAYLAALADLEDHGDQNAPGAESDNGGNRPGLLDVPSGRFNRSQDAGRSNVAQWTRSDGSGAVPIVKAMGVDTGVYQCVLCRGYVDCFRSGDSSGRERAVHESEHAAQLQLAYSGWWGPPQAGVGWKFEVRRNRRRHRVEATTRSCRRVAEGAATGASVPGSDTDVRVQGPRLLCAWRPGHRDERQVPQHLEA